jgi:hypothetical protein
MSPFSMIRWTSKLTSDLAPGDHMDPASINSPDGPSPPHKGPVLDLAPGKLAKFRLIHPPPGVSTALTFGEGEELRPYEL